MSWDHLVLLDAIEGGAFTDTEGKIVGTVLQLHGTRVGDSSTIHESFLLTPEAMSAVIAHLFTAARQLGPEVLGICHAATQASP